MRKFKILVCICLLFTLGTVLCGCDNKKADLSIDNHKWNFSHIQSNDKGEIIACSDENKYIHENAEILDIWCSIKDGEILISNNQTQESWMFNYTLNEENAPSYIYDISYLEGDEKKTGNAVVSTTSETNENNKYTLILTIGDYSIYFYEEI